MSINSRLWWQNITQDQRKVITERRLRSREINKARERSFQEFSDDNSKTCPFCGSGKIYLFKKKGRLRCGKCKRDFTLKTNTQFRASKLTIQKLSQALACVSQGLSTVRISKLLKVSQKTAWAIKANYFGIRKHYTGFVEKCLVYTCEKRRKFKGLNKIGSRIYAKTCYLHTNQDL